jgi:hypothetical protein
MFRLNKQKLIDNLFPTIVFIVCLTGFVFAFFLPVVGIILCMIGFIFALVVKKGDYRLDKFGILFSLLGLVVATVVGLVQLFVLSIPFLLPILKIVAVVAGLLKTIGSLFGA